MTERDRMMRRIQVGVTVRIDKLDSMPLTVTKVDASNYTIEAGGYTITDVDIADEDYMKGKIRIIPTAKHPAKILFYFSNE